MSNEQERRWSAERSVRVSRGHGCTARTWQRLVPKCAVQLQSPESVHPGGESGGRGPHPAGPRCAFDFQFIVKDRKFQARKRQEQIQVQSRVSLERRRGRETEPSGHQT